MPATPPRFTYLGGAAGSHQRPWCDRRRLPAMRSVAKTPTPRPAASASSATGRFVVDIELSLAAGTGLPAASAAAAGPARPAGRRNRRCRCSPTASCASPRTGSPAAPACGRCRCAWSPARPRWPGRSFRAPRGAGRCRCRRTRRLRHRASRRATSAGRCSASSAGRSAASSRPHGRIASSTSCCAAISRPIFWIRGSCDFSCAISPAGISHNPARRTLTTRSLSAAEMSPSPSSEISSLGGTGTFGSAYAATGLSNSRPTEQTTVPPNRRHTVEPIPGIPTSRPPWTRLPGDRYAAHTAKDESAKKVRKKTAIAGQLPPGFLVGPCPLPDGDLDRSAITGHDRFARTGSACGGGRGENNHRVVPAQAGTHSHRPLDLSERWPHPA